MYKKNLTYLRIKRLKKNYSVKNTGNHIPFALLMDIHGFQSFSFNVIKDKEGNPQIDDLHFYALVWKDYFEIESQVNKRYCTVDYTYCVAITNELSDRILDYIARGKLKERTDKCDWIAEFNKGKKSVQQFYTFLYPFKNLLYDTLFQRCRDFEKDEYWKTIIMFNKKDAYDNNDPSQLKNEIEVLLPSRNFYLDITIISNGERGTTDYGPYIDRSNDWMDDPDNYWNID